MPESALIAAVNQLSSNVEKTEEELTALREDIANLPDNYIPREEAKEKAEAVKSILGLTVTGLMIAGLIVFGLVLYVKDITRENCRDTRETLQEMVSIAVADRPVLSSSTPEAAMAIQDYNARTVRPLRERLLALPGTQPSKCR